MGKLINEKLCNLKRNWYFPLSAMAFFFLEIRLTAESILYFFITSMVAVIISSQIKDVWEVVRRNSRCVSILSMLASVGICWRGQFFSCDIWASSYRVQVLGAKLPIHINIPLCISVISAVCAFIFVYICVSFFWTKLCEIFTSTSIFADIKKGEMILYGLLVIAVMCFMTVVFLSTEAFYGTEYSCDLIYTSDSPMLIRNHVYLWLTYTENDLRQPLFAAFAAPFMGIPYLVSRLLSPSLTVQALLMNYAQILLLFFTNYMLSKMMKLSSVKRVCFMLLSSCTYVYLLAVFMMEQYIVAYFWLIFCLYLICEKRQPDRIALWGAGGTLLTSMILLPSMSEQSPVRSFRGWLTDMIKYGLEFVGLMFVFHRVEIFFSLVKKFSVFSDFTGKTVTFADKLYQYTVFIRSCIWAPQAGVNTTFNKFPSWQLDVPTGLDFIGIGILLLVIVSAVLNREKKSSRFAIGWVGFSVVMLLGLGWGTQENGLILYGLYFGWAFIVLLFQFVEKIESMLKVKFLLPIISTVCILILAAVNISAIMEMVEFAIAYFPV